MGDWFDVHEDKLKIASLIVASLVLLSAVYKWLLLKWRTDAQLRKYANLRPLSSKILEAKTNLIVEVPIAQHVFLALEQSGRVQKVLHDGNHPIGELYVQLDMKDMSLGDYEIVMRTADQQVIKTVTWRS